MSSLDPDGIDAPIRVLILGFSALPHCFTLQSCCGHFVLGTQGDTRNLNPLPREDAGPVRYRIAYLALCLKNDDGGRRLRGVLQALVGIDPEYVQWASPEWFWVQHPNSFALQVTPDRFKQQDEAVIDHGEALRVQRVRDAFFARLREVLHREAVLACRSDRTGG